MVCSFFFLSFEYLYHGHFIKKKLRTFLSFYISQDAKNNIQIACTWVWINSALKPTWCLVLEAQSCLTLCDPMDGSPPGSSVHEILQAGILERLAIPFFLNFSFPLIHTTVLKTPGPLLWKISLVSISSIFPILDLRSCILGKLITYLSQFPNQLLLQGSLLEYSGRWYLESRIWDFSIIIAPRVSVFPGLLRMGKNS